MFAPQRPVISYTHHVTHTHTHTHCRRMKASWKAFEERMLPQLKVDKPGLRLPQYKDLLWKVCVCVCVHVCVCVRVCLFVCACVRAHEGGQVWSAVAAVQGRCVRGERCLYVLTYNCWCCVEAPTHQVWQKSLMNLPSLSLSLIHSHTHFPLLRACRCGRSRPRTP